jgi:iron complex transport system substrate-binding protein
MHTSRSNSGPDSRARFLTAALFAFGIVVSVLLWNLGTIKTDTDSETAQYPRRIVSLTPSVTELLFAIKCEDKIVGVTQFCNYPPKAKLLPRLGGRINPNFERLLSLRPDLVIYQGNYNTVEAFCDTYNIKTMKVDLNNIDSIITDIGVVGQRLGAGTQAEQVMAYINDAIENVRQNLSDRKKVRVFFCLGRLSGSMSSLTTIGGDTFISEMIAIAGGENIFAGLTQDYVEINKEALRQLDPDVIIEARPGEKLSDKDISQFKNDWADMPGLTAVKNGNIHILTDEFLLMPTPRLIMTIEKLANVIHLEAFANE